MHHHFRLFQFQPLMPCSMFYLGCLVGWEAGPLVGDSHLLISVMWQACMVSALSRCLQSGRCIINCGHYVGAQCVISSSWEAWRY